MRKNILRMFLLLMLLCTFFVIFNFSSQDSNKSGGVSKNITNIIVEKIFKIEGQITQEQNQIIDRTEKVIRKIAHFSIYTLVGLLLMSLLSTYKIEEIKRIYISMIVGIIYATSDEIHQAFIPGRSAQITDVVLDSMGVLFGILLVLLILQIVTKSDTKNIALKD